MIHCTITFSKSSLLFANGRCFTLAAEEHDPTTELSRDRTTVCQFGAGVADSQLLAAVFQLNIIAQHDRTMNTVIVTD